MGTNKKDVSIELCRIIACIFVICIHISIGFDFDGQLSRKALFLGCVRADAVAIFWFITGAFIFRQQRYTQVLKGMARKVIIPVLILIICIWLFDGWIFGDKPLAQCFKEITPEGIKALCNALFLKWTTPVNHSGQLWYVFTYIILMLFFPVLKAYADTLNNRKNIAQFMIVSLSVYIYNEITQNYFAEFSHRPFGAAFPGAMLMIWGHIIYSNRETIANKTRSIWWIWGVVFVGVNLVRCLLQAWILNNMESPSYLTLQWYTSYGLVSTISIFFTSYFMCEKLLSPGFDGLIRSVGSYTFSIFLLHYLVIDYLYKIGVTASIKGKIGVNSTLVKQFAYYLSMGMLVFVLTLTLSILFRLIGNAVRRLLHSGEGLHG